MTTDRTLFDGWEQKALTYHALAESERNGALRKAYQHLADNYDRLIASERCFMSLEEDLSGIFE